MFKPCIKNKKEEWMIDTDDLHTKWLVFLEAQIITEHDHHQQCGRVCWLNLQNTIHVRKAHKHFVCVPKHTHTHARSEDYVSLRGHFSVVGEQLMWQTFPQMERERDGGRKWEGEQDEQGKSFSNKQLQLSFRHSWPEALVSSGPSVAGRVETATSTVVIPCL